MSDDSVSIRGVNPHLVSKSTLWQFIEASREAARIKHQKRLDSMTDDEREIKRLEGDIFILEHVGSDTIDRLQFGYESSRDYRISKMRARLEELKQNHSETK
jgi:hypothetical protein